MANFKKDVSYLPACLPEPKAVGNLIKECIYSTFRTLLTVTRNLFWSVTNVLK